MKKFLLTVFTLIATTGLYAQSFGNDSIEYSDSLSDITVYADTAEVNKLEPFDKTVIGVDGRIRFIKGAQYGVQILSNNCEVAKQVKYEVIDRNLIVTYPDDLATNDKIMVNVVAPELPSYRIRKDYVIASK